MPEAMSSKPKVKTDAERFVEICARARRSGFLLTIGLHAGPPITKPVYILPFATFGGVGNLPLAMNQVEAYLDEIEPVLFDEPLP
jgi:hypothetical protein